MCFDYDDYPEFVDEVLVQKSRKDHKCDDCGDTITTGSKYMAVFGKWDGEVESFKVCRKCHYHRELIAKYEIDEGCPQHTAYCGYGGTELMDHVTQTTGWQEVPEWFDFQEFDKWPKEEEQCQDH